MNKNIRGIIDIMLERIAAMSLFAMAFTVVGYFLPIIYTQHLDRTEYIHIEQPVSTQFTEYKRGDNIGLILNHRILTDLLVHQDTKIVHINGDAVSTQLCSTDSPKSMFLSGTNGVRSVIKTNEIYVPCDALVGRNYIQVLFTYNVRGVDKTYTYISDVFEVLDEDSVRCQR
jgi:hypothetical protein